MKGNSSLSKVPRMTWLLIMGLFLGQGLLAAPKVVASIRPLYFIATAVMEGEGYPILFMEGQESPHTYTLKPQDSKKITEADLILWVGPIYEGFLINPLKKNGHKALILQCQQLPGLHLLPLRQGEEWGGHSHTSPSESHSSSHPLHGLELDGHLWLDPKNAQVIAYALANSLAKLDPEKASVYQQNAQAFARDIDKVVEEIKTILSPVTGKKFIAFHDSYQYFEAFFRQVESIAALLPDPEMPANAKHLEKIRHFLLEKEAECIFREPQFDSQLVKMMINQTQVREGLLDPLGTTLDLRTASYPILLIHLAQDLKKGLIDGANK